MEKLRQEETANSTKVLTFSRIMIQTTAFSMFKTGHQTSDQTSNAAPRVTEPASSHSDTNFLIFSFIPGIILGICSFAVCLIIIGFAVFGFQSKKSSLKSKSDIITQRDANIKSPEKDTLMQIGRIDAAGVTEPPRGSQEYVYPNNRMEVLAALGSHHLSNTSIYSYVQLPSPRSNSHLYIKSNEADGTESYVEMHHVESDALYLEVLPDEDHQYLTPFVSGDKLAQEHGGVYENIPRSTSSQ